MKRQSKLSVCDYFNISWYFLQIGFAVYFFIGGLSGACCTLVTTKIIWTLIWGLVLAYFISLIGKAMDAPAQVKNPPCPRCGSEMIPIYVIVDGDVT